jgi:hypothetical protein
MTADWMRDGLCQVPAYRPLFTGEKPARMPRKKWTAAAKGVCGRCPVLAPCREWITGAETGITGAHHDGVIAALDAKERAAIARGGAR